MAGPQHTDHAAKDTLRQPISPHHLTCCEGAASWLCCSTACKALGAGEGTGNCCRTAHSAKQPSQTTLRPTPHEPHPAQGFGSLHSASGVTVKNRGTTILHSHPHCCTRVWFGAMCPPMLHACAHCHMTAGTLHIQFSMLVIRMEGINGIPWPVWPPLYQNRDALSVYVTSCSHRVTSHEATHDYSTCTQPSASRVCCQPMALPMPFPHTATPSSKLII